MTLEVTLEGVRSGAVTAGVHLLAGGTPLPDVVTAAAANGWRVVVLDGRRAATGLDFLDLAGQAFDLPEWYGRNWDALADCLGDLSWLPAERWLVVWDDVDVLERGDPRAVQVALDVLDEAAEEWAHRGKAFAALLRPAPDGVVEAGR